MFRVGYLTYGLDRAPTGIGRYAIDLLTAMAALPDAPCFVLLTTEREDRHGLWTQFERHALAGGGRLPALLLAGNATLGLAAHRYRLDVVHDPNGIAPFLGPSNGARRVITIHDAFAYVYPGTQPWLENWRYRWHLPHAARCADEVITVSQCSRRDLVRHLQLEAEHVTVIAEGVSPRFRPVPDGPTRQEILARYGIRPPYLLYLGGLNARKNIARLFDAFAVVRDRYPDLRLVVGGKRQWRLQEIDASFERHGLHDSVHFTGYIDDDHLPAIYSAATAFVFPSLYEGFGLPPLEAMACATPVVTSNTAALVEVVGDAAVTVDPFDVDGLVGAIDRVLTDSALRRELQRRGPIHAAAFTWNRAARETVAVYRQVLGRPRACPGRCAS